MMVSLSGQVGAGYLFCQCCNVQLCC